MSGQVDNTESMLINKRMIKLNDDGSFEEVIVLLVGLNIIEIDLHDSFGKEKKYTYNVYSSGTNPPYEVYYSDAQGALEPVADTELETPLIINNE